MKRLKLFISAAIIFFAFSLSAQQVDVKLEYPSLVSLNQEFELSITISKGDVAGFARLQLDFPQGVTVKSNSTMGSTFSFKESKARFLWMALPTDNEMKVICLVTITAPIDGSTSFEGAFSYVLNNETQKVPIPESQINIENGTMANNEVVANETNEQEKASENAEKLEAERKARELAIAKADEEKRLREAEEKRIKEEEVAENIISAQDAEKLERERIAREENALIEQEELKKKEAQEAKKLEAERKANTEAVARAEEERKVKEAEEKMQQEEAELNAKKETEEEVVKTEQNTEEKAKLEAEKLANEEAARVEVERLAQQEAAAQKQAEIQAQKEATARLDAERMAKAEADKLEKERLLKETQTEVTNKSVVSSSSVNFRVQVGASRQPAEIGYYSKLDKGISEFDVVKNTGSDGWYRYTIGSYSQVSDATALVSKVKQFGFEGFVVAFKDGQRISIKEAKQYLGQ